MREAVPLPLVVQVVPKQEAPELVIRMYGHCRLAVLEDGPALVRPGEYASGEVADVGNAGHSQSLDDGRARLRYVEPSAHVRDRVRSTLTIIAANISRGTTF